MRFNKQELMTLATQPSSKFEKEGVLFLRERQEGFFRRNERKQSKKDKREKGLRNLSCVGGATKVSLERWCRLRGNLLFYFKNRDQWSEPVGVIVLEQCQARLEPPTPTSVPAPEGQFPFHLVFEGGLCQALAATSDSERSSWLQAIRQASYECIRSQLVALRQCVERKRGHKPDTDLQMWRIQRGNILDMSELPLCEVSLACDNLLCDAHGRQPNPTLVVHVFMASARVWIQYARTEIIERSSNPGFLSTVSFRASDGINGETRVRFTVYDVRERVSHTAIPLGSACVLLSAFQDTSRLRIPLLSRSQTTIGFLTISAWALEAEDRGSSTEHTPCRTVPNNNIQVMSHRRSQSLPPRLGVKMRLPHQAELRLLCASPFLQTYRFHSGLGGDICVHELMAESKLCFAFPYQLLGVLIHQEKELLQEVAGMGELREPWHSRQVELLDRHLHLLRLYSQARENLQAHRGTLFKASSRKSDRSLEFAPVNLHLQRMWVHNDTLNKAGFYDVLTVGAFTAHSHKSKNGGLIKLLQQLKDSPTRSTANYQITTKISMASDAIQAIKQLRREVVDAMRTLMKLAKEKQTSGMLPICEDMISKTKILLSLWDPGLVEEALNFVEEHKLLQTTTVNNDDSGCVGDDCTNNSYSDTNNYHNNTSTTSSNSGGGGGSNLILSPFKRITQQLTSMDLKSPDLDDFATPCTPRNVEDMWNTLSNNILIDHNNKIIGKHLVNNRTNHCDNVNVKNHHHQQQQTNNATTTTTTEYNILNTSDGVKSLCSRVPTPDDTQFVIFPDADTENEENLTSTTTDATCTLAATTITNDTTSTTTAAAPAASTKTPAVAINGNEAIFGQENDMGRMFLDTQVMCNSPSANYYKPTDEPEPWDLTQLNIEASVMCLVSKVKFLCGRCGSPAVRLRSNQKTKKIITNQPATTTTTSTNTTTTTTTTNNTNATKDIDNNKKLLLNNRVDDQSNVINVVDTVQKLVRNGNKFTDGLDLNKINDWAAELRPSMRKLRQAMDGLLKTARLTHSVFRVQEDARTAQRACNVRYRRDVCFSQALTSLVTALMIRLWCHKPDPIFLTSLTTLGPLACFEGLLSYHGDEIDMWGDMSVAVEDLRTVMFTLTRCPIPVGTTTTTTTTASTTSNNSSSSSSSTTTTTTTTTTTIDPNDYLQTGLKVTGCRNALTVYLPVPDAVYSLLPSRQTISFHVTPVFFNIGINEMASLAESLGATRPQERSNVDNFERLNEYYLRYRKLNLPIPQMANNNRMSVCSPQHKPLTELVEQLRGAVNSSKNKNVEVLHLAEHICREMKGLRFTSCKSAKDRTGMSVTLEQCQILMQDYHLAEHEFQRALDCMRSEGCRRENTMKNIGVRKYAFNSLQLLTLPRYYRPPSGTYGSAQT